MRQKIRGPHEAGQGRLCVLPRGRSGAANSNTPVASSIDALLGRLDRVTQTGPAKWRAKCPAHDSSGLTLSIAEGDDGRALLNCFAGCTADEVVEAVGLRVSDLFTEPLATSYAPSNAPNPVILRRLAPALSVDRWVLEAARQDIKNCRSHSAKDRERIALARERLATMIDQYGAVALEASIVRWRDHG